MGMNVTQVLFVLYDQQNEKKQRLSEPRAPPPMKPRVLVVGAYSEGLINVQKLMIVTTNRKHLSFTEAWLPPEVPLHSDELSRSPSHLWFGQKMLSGLTASPVACP